MSTDDKDLPLESHEYDGIKELDNPLPDWWLATFLMTIMFAFFYWIHYEFSGGQTIAQELEQDLAKIESIKKSRPAASESEDELRQLLSAAGRVDQGREIFAAKCAVCHGPELQGSIGPNLTDEYWLHGKGTMTDIVATVRKGVLDKGMPNWDTQLKDDEIKSVAAFVYQSAGSHPANPKAPQGEKIVRE
jgi:cytochrome c oxidase cbb3-type subunit 3